MIDSARKFEKTMSSAEEVRAISETFLNRESNKPYLTSQVLIDKAYRLSERSYAYHENSLDYHVVNANIHVVESEDKLDVVRDESDRVLVSISDWAEVTRGGFRTYKGYGDHNLMLYQPDLDCNIGTIREILDQASTAAHQTHARTRMQHQWTTAIGCPPGIADALGYGQLAGRFKPYVVLDQFR